MLEVAPRGGDGAARWLEGAPCGHSGAAGGRNSDEAWALMVKESGECRADDGHDFGVCAIDALTGLAGGRDCAADEPGTCTDPLVDMCVEGERRVVRGQSGSPQGRLRCAAWGRGRAAGSRDPLPSTTHG